MSPELGLVFLARRLRAVRRGLAVAPRSRARRRSSRSSLLNWLGAIALGGHALAAVSPHALFALLRRVRGRPRAARGARVAPQAPRPVRRALIALAIVTLALALPVECHGGPAARLDRARARGRASRAASSPRVRLGRARDPARRPGLRGARAVRWRDAAGLRARDLRDRTPARARVAVGTVALGR